jgi:hypothetical protein
LPSYYIRAEYYAVRQERNKSHLSTFKLLLLLKKPQEIHNIVVVAGGLGKNISNIPVVQNYRTKLTGRDQS